MYVQAKRRYNALVAKTKTSPATRKEPPTPAKDVAALADVLTSVHAKAKVLSEALPYMQRYDRQTVVVK